MNRVLMRLIAYFWMMFASVAFAAPAVSQDVAEFPPDVTHLHTQAVASLSAGRTREAMPLLDEAIRLFEQRFASEKRQLFAAGSQPEALLYLLDAANAQKEAVVVDGRWAELFYLRAYAHNELGELEAGKRDLDALLRLSPANALALNERGFYFNRQKNWQAAAGDFEEAADVCKLNENPADRQLQCAAAQRGLAFTLTERGRWQDAEAIYQRLLQENPQDERAKHELEYIRQQRAKHPQI